MLVFFEGFLDPLDGVLHHLGVLVQVLLPIQLPPHDLFLHLSERLLLLAAEVVQLLPVELVLFLLRLLECFIELFLEAGELRL